MIMVGRLQVDSGRDAFPRERWAAVAQSVVHQDLIIET